MVSWPRPVNTNDIIVVNPNSYGLRIAKPKSGSMATGTTVILVKAKSIIKEYQTTQVNLLFVQVPSQSYFKLFLNITSKIMRFQYFIQVFI